MTTFTDGNIIEKDVNTSEFRFKREPDINVISKDEMEERVSKVFNLLWKTLSKSFGPYGAPTLILNYPYHHVTKDGYTIMKNLQMNASETMVDQAINNLCSDICGRLNYSVGDGTTSAVIATHSIYDNYITRRDILKQNMILPRDVIHNYENIKNKIIEILHNYITPIKNDDPETLRQNIYDVVYVSSNADEVISNYIADIYKELQFPAITCELAQDGVTKASIIDGYQFTTILNDKLYINSDDNVMNLDCADIIVFAVKVNKEIYEKILVPLNKQSRMRGRHLIVMAPYYDETTLGQLIRRDLNNEYNKTKDVNMVLMTYQATSSNMKKRVSDFSVLCDTLLLDKSAVQSIILDLDGGRDITQVFNIDARDIHGLKCVATDTSGNLVTYIRGIDDLSSKGFRAFDDINDFYVDNPVRLGYVGDCSLGLKSSLFKKLYYNTERYIQIVRDAETELRDTEAKYQKLGTFNTEVSNAQQRLYSLKLKMGLIEVGADSELSQKLLKDAVDDAVRAAASAFEHGIILGCNTHLIKSIETYRNTTELSSLESTLVDILYEGFLDVYRTVLKNAFPNEVIINNPLSSEMNEVNARKVMAVLNTRFNKNTFTNLDVMVNVLKTLQNTYSSVTLHDILIYYGLLLEKVFDVSTFTYTDKVVNSTQTDEEILKATIDLITLLIVGNQMVITQRHNF